MITSARRTSPAQLPSHLKRRSSQHGHTTVTQKERIVCFPYNKGKESSSYRIPGIADHCNHSIITIIISLRVPELIIALRVFSLLRWSALWAAATARCRAVHNSHKLKMKGVVDEGMAIRTGKLEWHNINTHEDEESNNLSQKRLVLIVLDGEKFILDGDFGIEFRAPVINLESYKPTAKKDEEEKITITVKRVRRRRHLGEENYYLPFSGSDSDQSRKWFYFSDGLHELLLGFNPEDNVVKVGERLRFLSLPRGGGEHEPVFVLNISFQNNVNKDFIVSEIADLRKNRFLHSSIYGEVAEAALLENEAVNLCQAPTMTVKIVHKGLPLLDRPVPEQMEILSFIQERSLKSSRFLEVRHVIEDDENYYIVSRSYNKGTLKNWLAEKGPLSEKEAATLMKQLFTSISLLHSWNVVHQDLSPENIALVGRGRVQNAFDSMEVFEPVLIDFSRARRSYGTVDISQLPTPKFQMGKSSFLCPELTTWSKLYGSFYDGRKVDSWQLGILLFILLTGRNPMDIFTISSSDVEGSARIGLWLKAVQKGIGNIPVCVTKDAKAPPKLDLLRNLVSSEALDLLYKLLTIEPDKRASVEGLLECQWFKTFSST